MPSLRTYPDDAHIALLRSLIQCDRGKGRVVGSVGPAAAATFQSCEALDWVESVSFDTITVWKITPSGRDAYVLALAEARDTHAEC